MLGRVWRKGNSLTLIVGMQIGIVTVENSMEVPQKTKNRITIGSSNPIPGLRDKILIYHKKQAV